MPKKERDRERAVRAGVKQIGKKEETGALREVGLRGASISCPRVSLEFTIITKQPLVISILSTMGLEKAEDKNYIGDDWRREEKEHSMTSRVQNPKC